MENNGSSKRFTNILQHVLDRMQTRAPEKDELSKTFQVLERFKSWLRPLPDSFQQDVLAMINIAFKYGVFSRMFSAMINIAFKYGVFSRMISAMINNACKYRVFNRMFSAIINNAFKYGVFSRMFSTMINNAFKYVDVGVDINDRINGKLLDIRRLRLKAKTKTKSMTTKDLLFAIEIALSTN